MKIFAVCDSDLNYAKKLAQKLSDACMEGMFCIQLFDSAEAILEYHKNTHIDTVLLGDKAVLGQTESFYDTLECFRRAGVNKVFVLSSEKEEKGRLKDYKCFYKYQAATALIKEIVRAYTQSSAFERLSKGNSSECTEVIGVFSPVNCVEKTIWALLAGMLLSEEVPVLYLNMEKYAGFDAILDRQHNADLSDVFYHILHGEEAGVTGVKEAVHTYKGLSYIPPIRFGQELSGESGEMVLKCIDKIIGMSRNNKIAEKTIIIDFSGSTEAHIAMCNMCDRIFLIQREDCITEATVKAFERECEALSNKELSGKIHKVCTGVFREQVGERFLELNIGGEFGKKIKQILQGEGLFD